MLNESVLLLNFTYEPLNVINVRRAIRLVFARKAELVEHNGKMIRSVSWETQMPAVVRLRYYIRRPFQRITFSKKAVFQRDNYTCQYCGSNEGEMTLDHIIPRSLGGETEWTNVVTACKRCNHQKGDRPLHKVPMKLIRPPREPLFLPSWRLVSRLDNQIWEKYLFLRDEIRDS